MIFVLYSFLKRITMALKIRKVDHKSQLEANVSSGTRQLLHIVKETILSSSELLTKEISYVVDLRFED